MMRTTGAETHELYEGFLQLAAIAVLERY